jgi:hypothetical protein
LGLADEEWVTFVDAAAFPRLVEVLRPLADAVPNEQKPKQRPVGPRDVARRLVDSLVRTSARRDGALPQTLLYIAVLEAVQALSPTALLLLWEDDCHMCRRTLDVLADLHAVTTAHHTASFVGKVGNGGSGILIPAAVLPSLLEFLKLHRSESNVDVLLWRATKERPDPIPDLTSVHVWSAHRGERSSFPERAWFRGPAYVQRRLPCETILDIYWGKEFYSDGACEPFGLPASLPLWRCGGAQPTPSPAHK